MRCLVFSFTQVSPILWVSFLALSTTSLWAQTGSPPKEIPVQLFNIPTQAHPHLHFTQTDGMRSFPDDSTDKLLPTNTKAGLDQATRTAELWDKEKYFIGSIPSRGLTFAPIHDKLHERTIYRDELEYYSHHIPWAGSLVGRICQQGRLHPHVTRWLNVLRLQFGLDDSALVNNSEVRASPGRKLPQVVNTH
jgi:hypothetical protein